MDVNNGRLLSSFLRLKDNVRASSAFARILIHDICPTRRKLLIRTRNELSSSNYQRILTNHDTLINYCFASGKLIHNKNDSTHNYSDGTLPAPAPALPLKSFAALGVVIDGEHHYAIVTKDGTTSLASHFLAERHESEVIRLEITGDTVRLKYGDSYVSAEIGGGVAYNRPVAKAWEQFTTL